MLRMGVPCKAYNILWDAALHNDEWKGWEKENEVRPCNAWNRYCFSQSLLFTHCCLILAILLLCGVDEVELLCITVLSLVTLVFQNIVIKLQICYVLDTATNKIVIHFRPSGCAAYCNACSFGHFLPEINVFAGQY